MYYGTQENELIMSAIGHVRSEVGRELLPISEAAGMFLYAALDEALDAPGDGSHWSEVLASVQPHGLTRMDRVGIAARGLPSVRSLIVEADRIARRRHQNEILLVDMTSALNALWCTFGRFAAHADQESCRL